MNFIAEKTSLWENLTHATKPVLLFGMGNGADRIFAKCCDYNIKIADIFATDPFVRGQSYLGYKMMTYHEICQKYDDFIVLIAFASESPEVLDIFHRISTEHEVYAPHIQLFGDICFDQDYFSNNKEKINRVYNLLADDFSRKVFADIMNYRISGKLKYLIEHQTIRTQDIENILELGAEETYLDLGAYNGDTIKEFIKITNSQYKKIFALEADPKNFRKLESFIVEEKISRTQIYNLGSWSEPAKLKLTKASGRQAKISDTGKRDISVTSIDTLLPHEAISFIKMDVEGAEKETLQGAKNIISDYQPKLFVACYHYDEDILDLPLLITELNPSYKIFLRRHPYVPAWELNILAK